MSSLSIEAISALGWMEMEEEKREGAIDQINDHETDDRPWYAFLL